MLALPKLSEESSVDILLLGGKPSNGIGVLETVRLLLECGKFRMQSEHDKAAVSTDMTVSPVLLNADLLLCNIQSILEPDDNSLVEEEIDNGEDNLLSTVSIAVSLLSALLELGTEKQSLEEERILVSMMPTLQSMSSCSLQPRVGEDCVMRSEIAEMASHAMALIASRQTDKEKEVPLEPPRRSTPTIGDLIEQAERDLQSEQPPLRARAMASIRRVARGYFSTTQLAMSPLIVELPQLTHLNDENLFLDRMFRVCVQALADRESYFYHASIQSIVAITDARPQHCASNCRQCD